ncbi:MAG TPA: hypothetical protein VM163_03065 [bacterium]|nr:hypothetical protein [bacterium]
MSKLSFETLTDTEKMEAADLYQKLEAIDAALADVQNERAAFESKARDKENFLRTERMKVQNTLRALRQATVEE